MPDRVRIQSWRKPGGKKPANVVVCARPSKWGNPYRVGIHGDAATCVAKYESAMTGLINNVDHPAPAFSEVLRSAELVIWDIEELRGRDLACYCPLDAPCHVDVLLKIANDPSPGSI